ncbi:hypothetical protein BGZ72_003675 [Mortierella alpina]|nr:hypothetical protein BGZ72_003675 [Mortierella alpina]
MAEAYLDQHMRPILLAPTGMAANNIPGTTIHLYFSLSRSEAPSKSLDGNRSFDRRESMISYPLLEVMSENLQSALGNNRSFGNCACIFFGDFGQLCPVSRSGPIPYVWNMAESRYMALTRYDLTISNRQQGDNEFLSILKAVRHYDSENSRNRWLVTNFLYTTGVAKRICRTISFSSAI